MTDPVPQRLGLFVSAAGNLALPAEKLIQVLEGPRLYGAPGLPEFVAGVVRFQNEVVPVVRPGAGPAEGDGGPAFVAVCGTSLGRVGFAFEAVRQITPTGNGTYRTKTEQELPGAVGSFLLGSEIYTVIDVDLLVECLPE